MTLAEVVPHLLRSNLATLKEAPKNPNTSSPCYNPNAWCSYHSESPGHNENDSWALKNKIQDLIEAKEIEFDAPEMLNVITAPMPKHNRGVNSVDTDLFVTSVNEVSTPLMTVKKNLLLVGLSLGCGEGCHMCLSLPSSCYLLKAGVQHLMYNREILFEKTLIPTVSFEDVTIITISANPSKAS